MVKNILEKKSLQTKEGLEYLRDTLIKLAKINEYSAAGILTVFGFVDLMEEEYQLPIIETLVSIKNSLDMNKTPSMYNGIRMILRSAKKAMKKYESIHGKIDLK
jgi:aminopeptidase N